MKSKKELLETPIWSADDIRTFFSCSLTKAYEIKGLALKNFGGMIPYNAKYVKSDSVLKVFGTSRSDEIKIINGGK